MRPAARRLRHDVRVLAAAALMLMTIGTGVQVGRHFRPAGSRPHPRVATEGVESRT